ncbi:MAG: hypothetical protein HEQ16_05115 [Bosea sp.]|nr:hypothetical protein [Bosea sp. (in: a-proteobacteria)]
MRIVLLVAAFMTAALNLASAQTAEQLAMIENAVRARVLLENCDAAEINAATLMRETRRVGLSPEDLAETGRFGPAVEKLLAQVNSEYATFQVFTRCRTIAGSLFGPDGVRLKNLVVEYAPQRAATPPTPSPSARAQRVTPAAPVLAGEDFVLDYKKFIGKRVTIRDCVIVGARLEFAGCFVGTPVMINVRYGDADRSVRKRALDRCSEVGVKRDCFARVTGRVRRSITGEVIGLDGASLEWLTP